LLVRERSALFLAGALALTIGLVILSLA
jgi:hypothetical protein